MIWAPEGSIGLVSNTLGRAISLALRDAILLEDIAVDFYAKPRALRYRDDALLVRDWNSTQLFAKWIERLLVFKHRRDRHQAGWAIRQRREEVDRRGQTDRSAPRVRDALYAMCLGKCRDFLKQYRVA